MIKGLMESLDELILIHKQKCQKLFENLEKNITLKEQADINFEIKKEIEFIDSLIKIKIELEKDSKANVSDFSDKNKEINMETDIKIKDTFSKKDKNNENFEKKSNKKKAKENQNNIHNINTNNINTEINIKDVNPLLDKKFKYYFGDEEIESVFFLKIKMHLMYILHVVKQEMDVKDLLNS